MNLLVTGGAGFIGSIFILYMLEKYKEIQIIVADHCRAIEKVFFEGKSGETYVIGGHNEMTNIGVANLICNTLDKICPVKENHLGITNYHQLIQFVSDRPGHDFRYAIDDSKLRHELNFQNQFDFETGLEITIDFYLNEQVAKKS